MAFFTALVWLVVSLSLVELGELNYIKNSNKRKWVVQMFNSETKDANSLLKSLGLRQQMVLSMNEIKNRRKYKEAAASYDPDWGLQEYLRSRRIGHNVYAAWRKGFTGKNITVAVVDDGLKFTHEEFKGRYFEYSRHNYDNKSRFLNAVGPHGTQCAGVIAAAAGNGICGKGVAYNARIAGIALYNNISSPSQADTANALYPFDGHMIDIFSNSWGPRDTGFIVEGPNAQVQHALKNGVNKGRNQRGSIYVFSAGNGAVYGDSCAFNGYVNSIYTIPVGAVVKNGKIADGSEPCGAVMTSAYSENLVTVSHSSNKSCDYRFGQTSGATAIVSGIIALALEANPSLTWRDVQHLVVRSSNPDVVKDRSAQWIENKANFKVSNRVGFGILDASKLVTKSKQWKTVPTQKICKVSIRSPENIWSGKTFILTLDPGHCNGGIINYLEHVQLQVDLVYFKRGVISMDIMSPSGTRSKMIYSRKLDALTGKKNYTDLKTTSVSFWGEPSQGKWTVFFSGTGTLSSVCLDKSLYCTIPSFCSSRHTNFIKENCQKTCAKGTMNSLSLILYGTETRPGDKSNENINECRQPNWCSQNNQDCINTAGAYRCASRCSNGYHRVRSTCQDINECLRPNKCRQNNQDCINTVGSYSCATRCPNGYRQVRSICQDIDECLRPNRCSQNNQDCINTNGSYSCADGCSKGYHLVQSVCQDINECLQPKRCSLGNRDCINTPGSYSCAERCAKGYHRVHSTCQDINECRQSNHCSQRNLDCINTAGSYHCARRCPRGYRRVQSSCQDINECWKNPCGMEEMCVNYQGTYMCYKTLPRRCPYGYREVNGDCKDIDECRQQNRCWRSYQYCINTAGRYYCVNKCPEGYHQVGSFCQDIDECSRNPCPRNENCENYPGTYSCKAKPCKTGYRNVKGKCKDIDECSRNPCARNEICKNYPGTYRCTRKPCQPGYSNVNGACKDIDECSRNPCARNEICTNYHGTYNCTPKPCQPGYSKVNGECKDIDECSRNLCPRNMSCKNYPGTYSCICQTGYIKVNGTCKDIDECSRNPCPNNWSCKNYPGTYSCKPKPCKIGYEREMVNGTCKDINECRQPNTCSQNNQGCINTAGSYRCAKSCLKGYHRLQSSCQDIDECSRNPCPRNMSCENYPGTYSCKCQTGYSNVNGTCKDINECLLQDWCGMNGDCINTLGSYSCAEKCRKGYHRVNLTCEDIDECLMENWCGMNDDCINTLGSYSCAEKCRKGYHRVNLTCEDLDRCSGNKCSSTQICRNYRDTYSCIPKECVSGHGELTGKCEGMANVIRRHGRKIDCLYKNSKGYRTVGIGFNMEQKNKDSFKKYLSDVRFEDVYSGKTCLTEQQIMSLFGHTLKQKIVKTQRMINRYNDLPGYVQVALVSAVYRGELKKNLRVVELINQEKWSEVPREYLNHETYKEASKKNSKNKAIKYQMEENAETFKKYAKQFKKNLRDE